MSEKRTLSDLSVVLGLVRVEGDEFAIGLSAPQGGVILSVPEAIAISEQLETLLSIITDIDECETGEGSEGVQEPSFH